MTQVRSDSTRVKKSLTKHFNLISRMKKKLRSDRIREIKIECGLCKCGNEESEKVRSERIRRIAELFEDYCYAKEHLKENPTKEELWEDIMKYIEQINNSGDRLSLKLVHNIVNNYHKIKRLELEEVFIHHS